MVNDGEVTALAGSMALRSNAVLGIALGTSTAAGYVTPEGNITSWLNELAFVPVDYHPHAPRDEWSGDQGCGVQYLSQQAVGRLLAPAGIAVDPDLPLPERLKIVQELMAAGDARRPRIYQTVGAYLGYAVAHLADVLSLPARARAGARDLRARRRPCMRDTAAEVLRVDFPELAGRIAFHIPDEKSKRHGQAIAAASLPALEPARRWPREPGATAIPTCASSPSRPALVDEGAGPARWAGCRRRRGRCCPPTPPRVLIFAPHPDDECLVGGLPLRLLRAGGHAGHRRGRHPGQPPGPPGRRGWPSCAGACDFLGFELVTTAPVGLERINAALAGGGPGPLAESRSR